jgi:lysophospholipase L1-like esterase
MKKVLLYNCCILLFISCQKEVAHQTFLALGDSYTIGESVPKDQRWPMQLVATLKEYNFHIEPPQIIAKTGWTTNELKEAIDNSSLNYPYDWVSLSIGVNNQYRGGSIEEFKKEFEILLLEAIAYSGNRKERVFVVSIPDWGVMPFAKDRDREQIAREIDDFNQVIYAVCAQEQIRFIDVTLISRNENEDPKWIADDQLHPGGAQYAQWVQEILPFFLNRTYD